MINNIRLEILPSTIHGISIKIHLIPSYNNFGRTNPRPTSRLLISRINMKFFRERKIYVFHSFCEKLLTTFTQNKTNIEKKKNKEKFLDNNTIQEP